MNKLLRICAAGFALLLGAQGEYAARVPQDAGIKSIAVISAIGRSFMFEQVTDSPLEWLGPPDTSFLEIADWGLDWRVTREAMQTLSKTYVIKPVEFQEADFDTWTWPTLLEHIDELRLSAQDIDAYVVILRDWCGDDIGGSVQQIAGLGLYRRDGDRQRSGVFACYRIAVIDARDDSILASRAVLTAKGNLPWVSAGRALWPGTQNDLSAAQKSVLENDVRGLIDGTLTPTLDEMFALR